LSRFREPGKININTIFDDVHADASLYTVYNAWDSIVGRFPGLRRQDNFLKYLAISRQGFGASDTNTYNGYTLGPEDGTGTSVSIVGPVTINQRAPMPTRFANPVRPSDSADLLPQFWVPYSLQTSGKASGMVSRYVAVDPGSPPVIPP